ncbi:hypothetical protein TOPH_05597 [Tolypocladium ophioglossoides CBS 100239]|uniref:Zona occludens toxin N-terminal domain-containing protein n=1 Tax=Tolypocladium ophioglossoides (strain CBS 100239) TaxID=1163406 RepID=A0A0L0N6X7_TOLOC|nr:hypothetical protein TOPH_05597 [Tolypocladium ophioglossoides CBS 100239]
MAGFTKEPETDLPTLLSHLDLLQDDGQTRDAGEIMGTPVFTEVVRKYAESLPDRFTQHGLLGGDAGKMAATMFTGSLMSVENDPRLYHNITAPSSVFICGSQGSGKSHTLSCLLENCLIPSEANVLPRPLTGIVFHYDTFISDTGGSPCEAAFLSSHSSINVRVLCPPTNVGQIQRIYSALPNVRVEELRFDESHLNTSRMMDLMAVSVQGGMPLYLHVVNRILRELRISQQKNGGLFNYAAFKRALDLEDLTPGQKGPLQQRLETLESFMVKEQVPTAVLLKKKKSKGSLLVSRGNSWTPKAGQLNIIDLSCPCVTADSACALFNICLSMFLEQRSEVGRVIALDEAHKYMTDTAECETLTKSLLSTIRLQRHIGARVFISTQEPTISPKLLDLCSVTIVHRFTSPDWLRSLKQHLAGATVLNRGAETTTDLDEQGASVGSSSIELHDSGMELFSRIVALRTGEALMFAPSAILAVRGQGATRKSTASSSSSVTGTEDSTDGSGAGLNVEPIRLGHGVMKIRVRRRITQDGGRSIMAG